MGEKKTFLLTVYQFAVLYYIDVIGISVFIGFSSHILKLFLPLTILQRDNNNYIHFFFSLYVIIIKSLANR